MPNYNKILDLLEQTYPDVRAGLDFSNPFELLIATILSAQTTDKQVNKITKALFADYPDATSMATLTPEQIEPYIKSCGVYRNKAKNISATCKILVDKYQARVPNDFDALIKLPGVGRKTANVVLSNAFGVAAIAVDTHVFRVSNRLGLAQAKDVLKTEKQLMKNIPEEKWSDAHHWMIWHGRKVCSSQRPKCDICTLKQECLYYASNKTEEAVIND